MTYRVLELEHKIIDPVQFQIQGHGNGKNLFHTFSQKKLKFKIGLFLNIPISNFNSQIPLNIPNSKYFIKALSCFFLHSIGKLRLTVCRASDIAAYLWQVNEVGLDTVSWTLNLRLEDWSFVSIEGILDTSRNIYEFWSVHFYEIICKFSGYNCAELTISLD